MPRSKRKQSGTDVYHVVSRGNNQNHILQNNDDKKYFRSIMRSRAEKFGVKVYAYCIMSNHVHILAKVEFKALSLFIQETNSTIFLSRPISVFCPNRWEVPAHRNF